GPSAGTRTVFTQRRRFPGGSPHPPSGFRRLNERRCCVEPMENDHALSEMWNYSSIDAQRSPQALAMWVVTFAVGATAVPHAQSSAANSQPVRADNYYAYYAAGNRIDVTAPMAGDVIVAGRQIDIPSVLAVENATNGWRRARRPESCRSRPLSECSSCFD